MDKSWTVTFYNDRQGRTAAAEFLSTLPESAQMEFRIRITYLQRYGPREDLLLPVHDEYNLYRLRLPSVETARFLLCQAPENEFIILHGFHERTARDVRNAILEAKFRKADAAVRQER